ncbi:hypothetical protein BBJ28_00012756 [Nothophytophthora sp. Chile5]|nr:hypothetical protein BBJ28_00012756 [Nothophytophthora sp. Chile5]
MALQKQRSLTAPRPSSSGGRASHSRGSLQTSQEYVARAQKFADARVQEALRVRAAATSGGSAASVDRSQWKLARGGGRHHAIACYKRVGAKAGLAGLRRQHTSSSVPMDAPRMTSLAPFSKSQQPAAAPSSPQSELLAVGVVPGALADVLHGAVNLSPEAMQIQSALAQSDLLDSRVLASLVAPARSAPFRSLSLKWALRHHEMLSRHRDYVYLEATGLVRDAATGERVGFHLVHSVSLPSAPELAPEMQIVRGHLSFCYLFRQQSDHDVELFFHGSMLPKGGARDRLAFALAAESVLAAPSAVECAMMKKLAFSLRTKPPAALRPPSPPLHQPLELRQTRGRKNTITGSMIFSVSSSTSGSHGNDGGAAACRVCRRHVRAFFGAKVTRCELCESPVCNRCRVGKKLFVFAGGLFHPQKMEFCSECMVTTNRLDATWVASQELAGAADRGRPSHELSGSEGEQEAMESSGYSAKTPASLGMSRIDEGRATMSSDGPVIPVGPVEPQAVVWLPTDHVHPRLTTVDREDEEDESDDYYDEGDDSGADMDAFVAVDDDDDEQFYGAEDDSNIPMIDMPSEGEEDDRESELSRSRHAVDMVVLY